MRKMARADDYKNLMMDNFEKMYTEKALKKYRPFYPIICRVGKPKDFHRFLVMAHACLTHDSYKGLDKIKAATLIIGADSDCVVGGNSSEKLAANIKGAKLHLYKGMGHAVYEEAKDFNAIVREFLQEEMDDKTGYPLYIVRNAGHNSNVDNPDDVNQRIKSFLNEV